MTEPSEEQIDAAYDEAQVLSIEVLRVLGLELEEGGRSLAGKVSIGIAGAALGLAAGRLMAAASEESFARWLVSLDGERRKTRASKLSEH